MSLKYFWLARRSDGHRFEGTRIYAYSAADAEKQFARMGWIMRELMVVGAR